MRQTAEAVIIGGGVMGCSIQYHLAKLGVTGSLLLEQDVLGSGSTGRSQTICRTHYSNPITTTLAWESLRVFTNFAEIVGGDAGFVKTGYLVVVESADRDGLRKNIAMQQELGVNTRLVTADDVRDLAPMVQVSHGECLAWEPESGYADSHQVTTSFAARAREMGAEVAMRTIAGGVEVSGGRVQAVLTSQGRVETPIAVVAAGPWSKEVFAGIGVDVPLSTVRHQVASIIRPVEQIPHHPIVGDIAQSFSFRPEGSAMTLVGFGEDEADLASYNQGVDLAQVPEVMERLVNRMPAMSEAYFRGGWSGLFTITPDWHPILDQVPGIEGLYCAIGFSGHGFKLSPAIGLAMAELITQGKATSVDLKPLRFNRFAEGDLLTSSYHYNVLA
ncbi:MAG: FAD-binding oxidoreductase [Chloroflexi bacterium]|nr:FAD-binding oxidoreductase [Chloroflexota bacterium]MDA1219763.1 FAD-binding oxidoreductase [Chloroflexota bacterium]